jgi:hypothetical protein
MALKWRYALCIGCCFRCGWAVDGKSGISSIVLKSTKTTQNKTKRIILKKRGGKDAHNKNLDTIKQVSFDFHERDALDVLRHIVSSIATVGDLQSSCPIITFQKTKTPRPRLAKTSPPCMFVSQSLVYLYAIVRVLRA